MKLTIAQVTHYDNRKDGTPLKDKYGKSYMRAVIKTNEFPGEMMSGFVYNALREGQTIDAEVKEEEYNGQKRKKFSIIRKQQGGMSDEQMLSLNRKLDTISTDVKMLIGSLRIVSARLDSEQVIDAPKINTSSHNTGTSLPTGTWEYSATSATNELDEEEPSIDAYDSENPPRPS